jgi:Zn-finger nucleic acid-binding protein
MKCESCGAAMELVPSRRHFACRHCGTSRFPEAVEADGVRFVGYGADAVNCPTCASAMAHALLHDEPIEFCETCRGMLVPRAAFAELIHRQRAWAATPPVTPSPLDRRALDRRLTCPRCGNAFTTYTYGGPGNTVLDGCTHCDLLWLDAGEFRQMIDAPGKDRGRSASH